LFFRNRQFYRFEAIKGNFVEKLALQKNPSYYSNMQTSRWFKDFGSGREVKYYHITGDYQQEMLPVTLYRYDTLFRKVSHKESLELETKWWMEQELRNLVHEVPEQTVPFLMAF
jgi:hypothetical protein